MNYQMILSSLASICIAVGALCAYKYKDWGKTGRKIAVACYFLIILLKTLEFYYSFSVLAVIVILITCISLYFTGKIAGYDEAGDNYTKKKENQQ